MSLSSNVGQFRKDNGLSQEYMAEKLNMSQATYSRLEHNDRRCAQQLPKLAKALDTTPEVLRAYHLRREPAADQNDTDEADIDKDAIIQNQAAELIFQKCYIDYYIGCVEPICG